jgi:hypothetical protein
MQAGGLAGVAIALLYFFQDKLVGGSHQQGILPGIHGVFS